MKRFPGLLCLWVILFVLMLMVSACNRDSSSKYYTVVMNKKAVGKIAYFLSFNRLYGLDAETDKICTIIEFKREAQLSYPAVTEEGTIFIADEAGIGYEIDASLKLIGTFDAFCAPVYEVKLAGGYIITDKAGYDIDGFFSFNIINAGDKKLVRSIGKLPAWLTNKESMPVYKNKLIVGSHPDDLNKRPGQFISVDLENFVSEPITELVLDEPFESFTSTMYDGNIVVCYRDLYSLVLYDGDSYKKVATIDLLQHLDDIPDFIKGRIRTIHPKVYNDMLVVYVHHLDDPYHKLVFLNKNDLGFSHEVTISGLDFSNFEFIIGDKAYFSNSYYMYVCDLNDGTLLQKISYQVE